MPGSQRLARFGGKREIRVGLLLLEPGVCVDGRGEGRIGRKGVRRHPIVRRRTAPGGVDHANGDVLARGDLTGEDIVDRRQVRSGRASRRPGRVDVRKATALPLCAMRRSRTRGLVAAAISAPEFFSGAPSKPLSGNCMLDWPDANHTSPGLTSRISALPSAVPPSTVST